ncbi:hypothetical protein ORV05_34710 [Amycolatopsis cynarae]|uniref:Uncharacterized protein n=1 Tax=Amycolatopsis cynarae TaxID=2995223 RepID=A0ABY7B573_9PSEU|nr:hypothetical protein [Amycolatopsis sp. HUAS 11-8]WAL65948.1 hypothetical protein ORV05_34710 [Amycolatopsis sp. HUAS 11-8]
MHPLDHPTATFILALLIVTLCYVWSCAVYPYKPCRSCGGAGQFRSRFIRALRLCHRCGGTGRTLRLGRRAYNALHRAHRRYRDTQRRNDNH